MRHRRLRLLLFLSAVGSVTLWTYACEDGTDPHVPEPTTITVSPATAELVALDATVQMSAEVKDQNGWVMAGATVTWASSATAVATVSASGLVTSVANGTATIAATAGSVSGSATVTVAQVVSSVTAVPAEASFAALGDTLRMTAAAFDANGHSVEGAEFSWESGDDSVATVDASGLVTAVASGTATIAATSGEASGSATVTVAQVVSSVAVAPDTATVVEGDTLRLVATATDANGHVVTAPEFVWASADTLVAVVDTSGLVTGVGAGLVQVTATAAEITGRGELTVVAPVPTTVAVTPDTVVLTALGHTTQLTAEVRDQIGRAMDGVPVAWSSADTTVAVVDTSGLVTAVRNGAATITAAAGEAAGGAHVNVRQLAGSVTVSPSMDSVAPGDTLRLVAAAYDETGHVVEGAVFAWSSSDAPVATVDPSGLVRGAGEGTATITATAGDVSGTSEVTVVNPDRAALVALYNATDGPNWVDNTNWLTDAPLGEWYGVSTDAAGRVAWIDLAGQWDNEAQQLRPHGLSGAIPPELGDLANLGGLYLGENDLSGAIPPELGDLANLGGLYLGENDLSGAIPPELGNLANLTGLGFDANDLSGAIPPELGDLANLRHLDLRYNALSGAIPPELGDLANLERLYLGGNALLGAIPQSFLQLDQLQFFYFGEQDVCLPGVSAFVTWFDGIEHRQTGAELFCNTVDVLALESLYGLTDGANWTESDGWLGNHAVAQWYGVTADSLGHVTELDLEGNGLAGRLSGALGYLPRMTVLRIADNALEDRLPLSDRDALVALYGSTGGPGWTNRSGWLTDAPLRRWYGVSVDAQGSVVRLQLGFNGLSGPIPPELGGLSNLEGLYLDDNDLSGEIPPELGSLSNLRFLELYWNELSGAIPPELGDLSKLEILRLYNNELTGAIPPELGDLSNLGTLSLSGGPEEPGAGVAPGERHGALRTAGAGVRGVAPDHPQAVDRAVRGASGGVPGAGGAVAHAPGSAGGGRGRAAACLRHGGDGDDRGDS